MYRCLPITVMTMTMMTLILVMMMMTTIMMKLTVRLIPPSQIPSSSLHFACALQLTKKYQLQDHIIITNIIAIALVINFLDCDCEAFEEPCEYARFKRCKT